MREVRTLGRRNVGATGLRNSWSRKRLRSFGAAFAGALVLSCTSGKQEGSDRAPRQRSVAAARPPSPAFDPVASIAASEYRFRQRVSGFEAANRAQDLRVRLDTSGALVSSRTAASGGTIRIALERVGREGASGRASRREPRLGACSSGRRLDEQGECLRRLEYERDGSVEWWENRPEGIEQGFTLAKRPEGAGALELDLSVSAPRVEIESATAAILSDAGLRVRYAGLFVSDADRRELPARFVTRAGGLRIVVDDRNARYPLIVDPILSSAPWVAEGNQETAYLGLSVASAGDVNNDGFSDVIIGAPLYDNGQADEGRVFVHHGSAMGLAATAAWSVEGNQAGARLGTSVASAGDVNGDGYGDVIIGAPNYDNGSTDEGRAYVHHGSATGLLTTVAWTAESNQVSALLGGSVAGAGDVNGDGYDDVIVGARDYDNIETGEGRVFIHFGATTGLALTASWTEEIDQASAQFGFSVAGAGDVNGDMFDDVIVGAKLYSNGETGEGAAFVYLGSMTGPALTADSTLESNRASAGFGHAVSSAGDVDNDGFSDVLVGAPAYNGGLAEEGQASLYLGSMTGLVTTAEWSVESNQATAELGFSVAGAGDVNADGFDDVVIGAQGLGTEAGGGALVFLGSASPFAMTADRTIEGSQARGAFGYAVASAGDVNDDGSSDVIVGAPLTDAGQLNEGRAFVFLGCVPTADSDGDGALDCADGCERDATKTAPGVCGCGVADTDSDSDGTLDCNDECPDDPASTSDGCPGGGEGGAGGADDGGAAGEDTGGSAGSGGATSGGSGGVGASAGSGGSAGQGANAGSTTGGRGGSAGRASGGTGTTDEPEPVGEDSSCGCRVPGSGERAFGLSVPALFALAFLFGRRRASRRRA